ncbi:MAG: NAD(P)-dependent oxidoreductase [Oscillochloridaceae bacterium umkhey_bin13]
MSITLFGLGLMGRPMARTLLAGGCDLTGWNRSPLAAELTTGIPLATSLKQAAQAEILILMLSDSQAVDALLGQLDPLLRPGQLVVDMGSSDPRHSRLHADDLQARGIAWVDAPVSGGPEGAATGSLAIMVGGALEAVARVQPLLNLLGRATHVGPAGAGHATKVINQLIVGLTIQAVAEATTLAEAAGLDPALVRAALAGGFADSKVLQIHGARMANRSYVPGGKVTTQLKDLRLAEALANEVGLTLPHLQDTLARYATLVAQDRGDWDHSALHVLLEQA